MFDDDTARRALHTLTDEPAPPVVTTLDQVVRRGRRRIFLQRAASVAGVVAVVAAIGVGTLLLRGSDQSGGVRVGTSNSATVPTQTMPGWTPVKMPNHIQQKSGSCTFYDQALPPPNGKPFPPVALVKPALTKAVEETMGRVPVATFESWQGSTSRFVTVDVPMDNGTGQVQLEAGRYGGTPSHAADLDIGVYGDCQPPLRRTLADGTVLQLYPANTHQPISPTQPLRIYLPGGFRYVITSAGYNDADLAKSKSSSSKTIVSGRGKLPTSQKQLADIAERFVAGL